MNHYTPEILSGVGTPILIRGVKHGAVLGIAANRGDDLTMEVEDGSLKRRLSQFWFDRIASDDEKEKTVEVGFERYNPDDKSKKDVRKAMEARDKLGS